MLFPNENISSVSLCQVKHKCGREVLENPFFKCKRCCILLMYFEQAANEVQFPHPLHNLASSDGAIYCE